VGISLDNVAKCILGVMRLRSGRWINDVTIAGETETDA